MLQGDATKIARQIGLIQAAVGKPFDPDPSANVAITQRVADFMAAQGMKDVRDLRKTPEGFWFDISSGNLLVDGQVQYGKNNQGPPWDSLFWVDQSSHSDDYIFCRFTPDGFPVFFAASTKRENELRGSLMGIASVLVTSFTLGAAGLAASIGSAVIGPELAAAYPALAQGIGQAALSTAMNGGDVKAGVMSAVTGGIGGAVGSGVASFTDSSILGSVASSVTKTAISGGDLQQAALMSLASSGLQSASQLPIFSAPPEVAHMDDSFDTFSPLDPFPLSDPTEGIQIYTETPDLGPYSDPTTAVTGYHDPVWSVNGSAEGASVPMPNATTPPAGPGGAVATGSDGSVLTQLALTGLKLVGSWNQAGQPAVRTANATVRPNANGTLTNLVTGATTQMPKGTPYLLPNGTLVTNNGDGSYSTVGANGQASMTAYTGTTIFGGAGKTISIGGVQVSPALLGLAALGAVLLLRR